MVPLEYCLKEGKEARALSINGRDQERLPPLTLRPHTARPFLEQAAKSLATNKIGDAKGREEAILHRLARPDPKLRIEVLSVRHTDG